MNRKKGIKAKTSGKNINKQGQTNEMKEEIDLLEETEDVTKYGEFVPNAPAAIADIKKSSLTSYLRNPPRYINAIMKT